MTAAELHVELQKVASMVATARRLMAGGTMVDLAALQGKVAHLCESIGEMPIDEGRSLQPGLESLLRGLDGLQGDLDHLHTRMTGGHGASLGR